MQPAAGPNVQDEPTAESGFAPAAEAGREPQTGGGSAPSPLFGLGGLSSEEICKENSRNLEQMPSASQLRVDIRHDSAKGIIETVISSQVSPDSCGVLTSEQRENPSLLPQTLSALRLSSLGNKPLREVSQDELPYIVSYLRSLPEEHSPLSD